MKMKIERMELVYQAKSFTELIGFSSLADRFTYLFGIDIQMT